MDKREKETTGERERTRRMKRRGEKEIRTRRRRSNGVETIHVTGALIVVLGIVIEDRLHKSSVDMKLFTRTRHQKSLNDLIVP